MQCCHLSIIQLEKRIRRLGEITENKDLTATDLCVPIYLNQQMVFDLLAVLEDGFYQLSNITTAGGESENRKTGFGGSIGASNVFALLGISFKGEHSREKGTQEQTEVARERVHTPTSLFSRLRMTLDEKSLLMKPKTLEEIESSTSGQFVEFRAVLRKNPLVETIEGFQQLMKMADLFSDEPSQAPHSGRKKGRSGKGGGQNVQPQNEDEQIAQQMQRMLDALAQAGSLEIIGEMLDVPSARAVLSTKLEFFSDQNASEIIDGEFRVLGKVIRVVKTDSEDSINLLRKTSFGILDSSIFDGMGDALEDQEGLRLNSSEFTTEIEGPALQLIPIAIFT